MSNEITLVRDTMLKMQPQFESALPSHIPAERFTRVAMTAIQNTPDLLAADRQTLFVACLKAAQDGLLPDGREAALTTFNTKQKDGSYKKAVQYMPMMAGLLKKARNSGSISTISAHVAYERDEFHYTLGDSESISHKPFLGGDRGKPVLVYAIAHLKDGSVLREVMTVAEVEKVRAVSKAKDGGPWTQWWDQMARKTVIRRLSKYLPSATDRDDFQQTLERDDELAELPGSTPAALPASVELNAGIAAASTAAPRRGRPPKVIDGQAQPAEPQPQPEPAPAPEAAESAENQELAESQPQQQGSVKLW